MLNCDIYMYNVIVWVFYVCYICKCMRKMGREMKREKYNIDWWVMYV